MRRLTLVATVVIYAGCTSLLGPRQDSADLGVTDGAVDLSTEDLAVDDLSQPADLTGIDALPTDLKILPDLIGLDGSLAGIPNDVTSSIQIMPGAVTADGSSNAIVSVTVRDASNVIVVGQPVMLSSNGSLNTITPANGITNAQGVFNATLSSTKAELKTVTANIASFMLQAQVQFNPSNPLAGSSTFSVNPGTIAAGGTTSTLTVTVKDSNGNPVNGQAVSLTSNGTGNTLTPPNGSTDASGVFSATFSSTKAELKTVTATVGTFTLNQLITVVAGAADASASTVVASPVSSVVANGSAASTVTVTVRDANNNLASGVNVVFSATGGSTTLTPASGSTDASGVVTSALTATSNGAKQVTAVAGGVTLTQKPTVTFDVCPTPTTLTVGAAPVAGNTTGGTNLYHASCALPTDAPDKVYGFSLASASSVMIDRSGAFAGSVTELRSGSACTVDGTNFGCTRGRYLYCPNLAIGSYELLIDGAANAAGPFNLGVTAAATKGSNSYGVLTLPADNNSFNTISGVGTQVIAAETPTGMPIPQNGNTSNTTTLPFGFTYFGTSYASGSTMTIYQQGYLSFGATGASTYNNVCLPSGAIPSESIVPFWGRLVARSSSQSGPFGKVLVATQGTAPNRTFTVEWNQMEGFDASGFSECIRVSIQAILYEANSQIEFRYKPEYEDLCGGGSTSAAGLNMSTGGRETIGLQSGSAAAVVEQLSCNAGNVGVIGTCTRVGGNPGIDTCVATKAYVFVPRHPSCP